MLISAVHPSAIVMSADSRKTLEKTPWHWDDDARDFVPGLAEHSFEVIQKLYPFGGAGCFSFWGDILKLERTLPQHLRSNQSPIEDVVQLRDFIDRYLKDVISPHKKEEFGDLGFHIGGYDKDGKPRLFHVFWGIQADENRAITQSDYHSNDQSDAQFLFNGVNQYAREMIRFLIQMKYEVGLKTLIGDYTEATAARLNDFIIRYTRQLEQTVGDAILTNIILPDNQQLMVVNTTDYPIQTALVAFEIHQLIKGNQKVKVVPFTKIKLGDPAGSDGEMTPVAVP